MLIVIGLGNPGREYERTRHNAGFDVIDVLSEKLSIPVRKSALHALIGEGFAFGKKIVLVKPQTFMNLSGESVRPLMDYYHIPPEDLFVLVDDVNLDIGTLRIRRGGSDGGHNGLKNITEQLGTKDYARLRIGAGAPPAGGLVDFVLSGFTKEDRAVIDETLEDAAEACLVFISEGVDKAMNLFNGVKRGATGGEEV